jgi:hypothetical protein
MIKDRNFNFSKLRDSNGTIMSKGSKGIKHCLGNENHTNDFHVWEPKAVEDKDNKTFDKAYGYIPKEGTIQ